jgi:hypothetical protein
LIFRKWRLRAKAEVGLVFLDDGYVLRSHSGIGGGLFGKGTKIQQNAVTTSGSIPVYTAVQYHWILGKESFILLVFFDRYDHSSLHVSKVLDLGFAQARPDCVAVKVDR